MARASNTAAAHPVLVVPLAPDRSRIEIRVATILCAAIAVLFVGNLGRIPIFSTGGRDVPILVNDLAIAVLLATGALAMASHRKLCVDRASGLALLFAGVGALSAALAVPRFGLSAFDAFVSVSYLARWLFYFAVYVVVINTIRVSDVPRVWNALEGTILAFAAFGIFQSAFLPGFAQMVYPDSRPYLDWDIQGRRLVSTWLDPNYAGAFIAIGLMVCLARLACGARVAPWKLLVLGVALILTASRSSILALAVSGLVLLAITGLSKRLLRVIGVAALLILAALPKLIQFATSFHKLSIDPSAMARLTSWLHGWIVLRDHWVIGIGFNTWGYVSERYGWIRSFSATYGIDGGLFFVLVLTGIVGLGLYAGMLWSVFRTALGVWRDRERPAEARGLALGAAVSVPLIVVHSLFSNSLLLPFLMEPLWVLWALPSVLATEP
jgi:O-Antigen ligase